MATPIPEEAGVLFRVAPAGFIAERDALVGRLREDGREDDAAAVKALRKPTVPVWALNQLAERAPGDVQALLEAGRELRAAQRAAVSSRGAADRLLAATAARRSRAADLATVAAAAIDEVGAATAAQRDQLAAALETASIDEEVGAALAAGRFTLLPGPSAGFGEGLGLTALPGGRDATAADEPPQDLRSLKAEATRRRREDEKAQKAALAHRDAADELGREREELRRRLREVEAAHAEAVQRAHASQTDRKRTERALAKAEAAVERHRDGA